MPLLRGIYGIYNDPMKSLRFGIAFAVAAIVLIVVGYIGYLPLRFCRYLGFACIPQAVILLSRYRVNRSRHPPQPPPSVQPPPYPATNQPQMQPSAPSTNTGSTDVVSSPLPYPPYPMSPGAPPPYSATGSWQANPQSGHELPPPPSYDEVVKGSNNDEVH